MSPRSGEKGVAIIFALMLMVTGILIAIVLQISVQSHARSTIRTARKTQAEYVAESAMNWALSVLQSPPAFAFATHGPDSQPLPDSIDGDGNSCTRLERDDCNKNCARIDTGDIPARIYFDIPVYYDDQGWLCQDVADASYTLSDAPYEKVSFMAYYTDGGTVVRVRARGTAGVNEAEVRMRGAIEDMKKYIILSDGDIAPVLRKTPSIDGPIHANGDIYLGSGELPPGATFFKVTTGTGKLTATGDIWVTKNIYKERGDSKSEYVLNSGSSYFPGVNSIMDMWGDGHVNPVQINGSMADGSDEDNWNQFPKVEEGVDSVTVPSFSFVTPDDPGYPGDCGQCRPVAVHYSSLSGSSIEDEWVFNGQYGAHRNPGQTYYGYYAESTKTNGAGHHYNWAKSTVEAGQISGPDSFVQSGYDITPDTNETRTPRWAEYYHKSKRIRMPECAKNLENNVTISGCRGKNAGGEWDNYWYGGAFGGEWVKVKWLNLSNPNNYPKRCSQGGILDFGNENVMVVRACSLHYPITIRTSGEVYLAGDFNVGEPYDSYDGDTTLSDALFSSGAIKPAAIIADSNRIWFLSFGFLEQEFGYNLGRGEADVKANRDGLRGQQNIWRFASCKPSYRMTHHDSLCAGLYVAMFVTGAPIVDQAFYVSSRSQGISETMTPNILEVSRRFDKSNVGSCTVKWLFFYLRGVRIFLNNAVMESDWDPAAGNFDAGLTAAMSGRFGDGWPPRQNRIAPRYGRGYMSILFYESVEQRLTTPPGIGKFLVSRHVYKK